MKHYTRVITLEGTSYTLGELISTDNRVTDIVLDTIGGELLSVMIWTTTDNTEKIAVVIPYHAVELLVR